MISSVMMHLLAVAAFREVDPFDLFKDVFGGSGGGGGFGSIFDDFFGGSGGGTLRKSRC